MHDESGSAGPQTVIKRALGPKVGHNGDFAPATGGWVEGYTGAARVRCMTCRR